MVEPLTPEELTELREDLANDYRLSHETALRLLATLDAARETPADLAGLLEQLWALVQRSAATGDERRMMRALIADIDLAAGVRAAPPSPGDCGARHPKHPTTCRRPSGHDGDHATARRDVVRAAPPSEDAARPEFGGSLASVQEDAARLREALSLIQDICKPNGVSMSGRRLWDGGAGGNKQRIWELCEAALGDPS